jgi:hypothetical protein
MGLRRRRDDVVKVGCRTNAAWILQERSGWVLNRRQGNKSIGPYQQCGKTLVSFVLTAAYSRGRATL